MTQAWCGASPTQGCRAEPTQLWRRSQLNLALEQQEQIQVAWENSHWLQKFQPDANLGVPGAGWKEFGDASAEQGVVSPPHSLIQM